MKKLLALMLLFGLGMFTVGCDKPDTPAENAAEAVEDATDDAGDNLEDAGDDLEDAAEDAAN